MSNRTTEISQRHAALVAGFGLLIMTIFYVFADYFIFQKLIVPGDASATASNIMASEMLFRTGICSILIVLICDVVVAWALYIFLKQVNKSLSLLTAWLRLVYAAMLGIALFNLVIVLILVSGANYLVVFEADQLHAQVLLYLNAFYDVWAVGLIVFGFHLVALGYLAFKSDYIPKILSILLMAAGLGYLIDYFGSLLFPNSDVAISMVLGWGELIFMFWLLFKGGKMPAKDVGKESNEVKVDE
jgi:hypothetical protein